MGRPRRLTDEQAADVCRRYLDGATYPQLIREFGVSRTVVARAIREAGVQHQGGQPRGRMTPENRARDADGGPVESVSPPGATEVKRGPGRPTAAEAALRRAPLPRPEYRDDYARLGAMPADPVARVGWMHAALGIAAHHILTDADYPGDEVARRAEFFRCVSRTSQSTPPALIADTVRIIQSDADQLDEGGGDYEPEPADSTIGSIVGAPRRGRPRRQP